VTRWPRLRRLLNLANGTTPLGVAVAVAAGATLTPGPEGTLLAHGYRWPLPRAAAFTVGDVVLTRHPAGYLAARPALLDHELRHTVQYAACAGLPMLLAYAVAAGWSWLRAGDPASANPFERHAGLAAGGYQPGPAPGAGRRAGTGMTG
jgi:hypothetical protein